MGSSGHTVYLCYVWCHELTHWYRTPTTVCVTQVKLWILFKSSQPFTWRSKYLFHYITHLIRLADEETTIIWMMWVDTLTDISLCICHQYNYDSPRLHTLPVVHGYLSMISLCAFIMLNEVKSDYQQYIQNYGTYNTTPLTSMVCCQQNCK